MDKAQDPNEAAELARRRYRLRSQVLKGKANLPPSGAARLIGPDCAYHLYRRMSGRPDDQQYRDR